MRAVSLEVERFELLEFLNGEIFLAIERFDQNSANCPRATFAVWEVFTSILLKTKLFLASHKAKGKQKDSTPWDIKSVFSRFVAFLYSQRQGGLEFFERYGEV